VGRGRAPAYGAPAHCLLNPNKDGPTETSLQNGLENKVPLQDLCPAQLYTVKKLRDSWIFFDQTFQGLGLGKLFPARESLVSDIPAGDRKLLNLYLQCETYVTGDTEEKSQICPNFIFMVFIFLYLPIKFMN